MAYGRIDAAQAAAEALDDLGYDPSLPIDPFDAINHLDLDLVFWSLGDLLGAIVPGDPSGVLINKDRPASVQRFTAAHEIGHWYLDQDHLAVDTSEEVEGTPHTQRERNAQTFAAHFLMPLDLIYRVADEHHVAKNGPISPTSAYAMARDMHVSYKAAVHQLANCHFISDATRSALLRVQPQSAKLDLTHGRKLSNPYGDVWVFDGAEMPAEIELFAGDEVVFELPENPSTGYRWMQSQFLEALPKATRRGAPPSFSDNGTLDWAQRSRADSAKRIEDDAMEAVDDTFAVPNAVEQGPVGEPGVRRLGYSARRAGLWNVELTYARPFDPGHALDSLSLAANVRPLPREEEKLRRIEAFRLEEAEAARGE